MRKSIISLLCGVLLVAAPTQAQARENPVNRSLIIQEELTQWHHAAIGSGAYRAGYSGKDVIVAVIDSGVDGTHPDLQGRVVPGFNALTLESIDPYENSDSQGHGTHVAGIIAANSNGTGVTGVAPEALIMPIKVLGFRLGGAVENPISLGIKYAADNGADVINMSLGFEPGKELDIDDTICEAVSYANEKGVTVVAAAGNSATSGNPKNYPAGCAGVITVGSIDSSLRPSWFSSYDRFVAIAAPGSNIYSTLPLRKSSGYSSIGYGAMSGTSMAAPMVAGAVAILKQAGVADSLDIVNILQKTATDILSPGIDPYTGSGVLNINKALGSVLGENADAVFDVNKADLSLPEISSLEYLYDNTVKVSLAPGFENSSYPHYLEILNLSESVATTVPLDAREVRYTLENVPEGLVLVRPFVEVNSEVKYGAWAQVRNKTWAEGLAPIEIPYKVTVGYRTRENSAGGPSIGVRAEWSKSEGLRLFYFKKRKQKFELTVHFGNRKYSTNIKNSEKLGSIVIPKTKNKKIIDIGVDILVSRNNE